MHTALLSRQFYQPQLDFCSWACANDWMRDEELAIDDVEVRFLGTYGSGVGILGR